MFKCDQCGKCCEKVHTSEVYKYLADETGKCKYLKNNLCAIYEQRPLICRVDEMYETYYKELMTLEEFYVLNYKACDVLKSKP